MVGAAACCAAGGFTVGGGVVAVGGGVVAADVEAEPLEAPVGAVGASIIAIANRALISTPFIRCACLKKFNICPNLIFNAVFIMRSVLNVHTRF